MSWAVSSLQPRLSGGMPLHSSVHMSIQGHSLLMSCMFDLPQMNYVFFASVMPCLESLGDSKVGPVFYEISSWDLPYMVKTQSVLMAMKTFTSQESSVSQIRHAWNGPCYHEVIVWLRVCLGFFKVLMGEAPMMITRHQLRSLCIGHQLNTFHSPTLFGFGHFDCCDVVRCLRLGLWTDIFPEAVLPVLNIIFLIQKRSLVSLFLSSSNFSPRSSRSAGL